MVGGPVAKALGGNPDMGLLTPPPDKNLGLVNPLPGVFAWARAARARVRGGPGFGSTYPAPHVRGGVRSQFTHRMKVIDS